MLALFSLTLAPPEVVVVALLPDQLRLDQLLRLNQKKRRRRRSQRMSTWAASSVTTTTTDHDHVYGLHNLPVRTRQQFTKSIVLGIDDGRHHVFGYRCAPPRLDHR